MQDTQYLDGFIGELLHINEVSDNKLIDLGANNKSGTYVLGRTAIDVSAYALGVISERLGKTANTILLNSALSSEEQRVNRQINAFEWRALDGSADKKALHTFIENARKELALRGNNTLFLSVGALKWRVATSDKSKDGLRDVISPYLIFPVRLVAGGKTAPVAIEFIEDDIYINPCLIAKLVQLYGQELVDGLPKIGGADANDPVDMEKLGDGVEYFKQLKDYIDECNHSEPSENTLFEFDKDVIAIAQYKHDELCTYYDIRRNKDKIYSHPLVEKIFVKSDGDIKVVGGDKMPRYVLPHDSVQEKIIEGVVNGQSMIIKGPPGTGKTVTIANMIAALLAENKKVLFASKKISALGEVYAKLPERLRKFTMLLDSETESNAAKISPDEVKNDFKVLITNRKQYKEGATLNGDYSQTSAERAAAMRALSNYIQTMFQDGCIAGDSFYNALDAVCKNQLPVIAFADDADVLSVSREQYAHMLSRIGEAERCFKLLSDDGKHAAYKCPWFGIDLSCDSERALSACVKLGSDAESVLKKIEGGLKDCGLDAGAFTLMQIYRLHGLNTEKDAVKKIIADNSAQAKIADISRRLDDFLTISDGGEDTGVNLPQNERLEGIVIRLGGLGVDEGLTLEEIKCVSNSAEVFYLPDGSFIPSDVLLLVSKVVKEIETAQAKAAEHMNAACEVFKSNLNADELKVVSSAVGALSGYFESCPDKPKAFDFKGKKTYANLRALSYLSSPTFKEVVAAVKAFAEAEKIAAGIAETEERIFKFFKRRLSRENLDCIKSVLSKCADELIRTRAFVEAVSNNCNFIEQCYGYVEGADILTLGQLISRFERAYRLELLAGALEDFNQLTPVYAADNEGNEVETAYGLIAAGSFISTCLAQGAEGDKISEAFDFIRGLDENTIGLAGDICGGLESFGARYFRNYFVINGEDNTFEDLKILSAQAGNRDVISAAVRYGTIKNDPSNALDLNGFLYWFEKGGILPEGATFADAFEHSFFALAVRARNNAMGLMRNGMGNFEEDNLKKLEVAEDKLHTLNAEIIESKCFSRFDADDNDFIFVQDRNPNENLRLMFKRHAQPILKLKKCFILSPYTASLLFNAEDFEDFDVLIVDEASQMEPALILPVLFRSKQCVIVGDEWQMPPIKHFVALSPVQGEEEGYGALEPEISVLGLALRNGGFPVKELVCHYRSKTETLIRFSQKAFYPNMRTFPAPVPARLPSVGVTGLGLKDVFVEGGTVSSGKNAKEVDKVVEELKLHFKYYYDDKSGKLSMPVGVVAFGQAQCDAIESKVKADKDLSGKISKAIETFKDLPEKLIFFKTIETVQGQETGHLILSLTHGRRESGLYMHFGQLNQGKLGRCIFNVAVTRAQYMVTIVHSVRASEITGDNISYIKEYLETVERFDSVGRDQFVCEDAGQGFVSSVADFIESKGIPRERIVTGYGVTGGSVRIPVAILSKDLSRAIMGVWCERETGNRYDYLDYNMRYRRSLEACGWKLHRVSIHDWVDNKQNEQRELERALDEIIKSEEKNSNGRT